MVPYAGHDPSDLPFGSGSVVPACHKGKRSRALKMFKAGKDTATIAAAVDAQEPTVERWITRERCERLGLPNPYEAAK